MGNFLYVATVPPVEIGVYYYGAECECAMGWGFRILL